MYILKVLLVFSGLNLKLLFTDLCVRWNIHSEIGLNEKKKTTFSHDSKIELSYECFSHFPNYIFFSEVLSYAISYLSKAAFSKLTFSQAMHFLKLAKKKISGAM